MIDLPIEVLAIFAHPDDAELSCFGTLLKLKKKSCKIHLLVLSAGELSIENKENIRHREGELSCKKFGFTYYNENLKDSNIQYDFNTISTIEKYVKKVKPKLVLTHFPQESGFGHQDHLNVSKSVNNVCMRNEHIKWVLYAEPQIRDCGFMPNIFINVTEEFKDKLESIKYHKTEKSKFFMNSDFIHLRANWRDSQLHGRGLKYESFILVRGEIL